MPDFNNINKQISRIIEKQENEVIRHRIEWIVEENMPNLPQISDLSIHLAKADNKEQRGDILATFLHELFEV